MDATDTPATYRHAPPRPPAEKGQRGNERLIFGERVLESGGRGECVWESGPSFLSETISRIEQQQYRITPQLLLGTPVSELKRALLRSWIYQQAAAHQLERRTVATATALLDLFLQRDSSITMEDFQAVGIAALILANKFGSREIKLPFDERVFPRRVLNDLQERILRRLQFKITPVTYVQLLDELVGAWNDFAERHSDLWMYRQAGRKAKGRAFSAVGAYELLDTLFLVTRAHSFNLYEITLEAFRSFLERDHQAASSVPKSIEDEVMISFWHNPEDEPLLGSSFETIFQQFLNFLEPSTSNPHMQTEFNVNHEVEAFVHSFLRSGFESTVPRESVAQNDKQTFNGGSLKVARQFIGVKKNYRKSSGETLAF